VSIKGYITGVRVTDYQPRVLGYGFRCDECWISVGLDDMRVRDMLAQVHFGAYGHFPVRTQIIQEPWTPFNPEGYIDDERLRAEGFYPIGTIKEGEGPVMAR
jgi:hypothetical protein